MLDNLGLPEAAVVAALAVMAVLVIWPAARICRRAGLAPWLGILAAIPIANLLLLWFVALARWPALNSTSGA